MNKLIIFPTDTVYGIGCSIYDKESQLKIYEIKHRDQSKPLAVLCANLAQIEEIAHVDERAKKLILKFLPGAVTFILEAKPKIKEILGFETIGVRIPNAKLPLEILEEMGPMTTTSVNESGQEALDNYELIKKEYGNKVDKIYEKDFISSSQASTVVSLIDEIKVLREGTITKQMIIDYLEE